MSDENRISDGPWDVAGEPNTPTRPYIVAVTSKEITRGCVVSAGEPTGGIGWPAVGKAGISVKEQKANARLIAAAPQMYGALKMVERAMASGQPHAKICMPIVNEALNKAEGIYE